MYSQLACQTRGGQSPDLLNFSVTGEEGEGEDKGAASWWEQGEVGQALHEVRTGG